VIEITGGTHDALVRTGAKAALPLTPGKTAKSDADPARTKGKRLKSAPKNATGAGKAPSAARKGAGNRSRRIRSPAVDPARGPNWGGLTKGSYVLLRIGPLRAFPPSNI